MLICEKCSSHLDANVTCAADFVCVQILAACKKGLVEVDFGTKWWRYVFCTQQIEDLLSAPPRQSHTRTRTNTLGAEIRQMPWILSAVPILGMTIANRRYADRRSCVLRAACIPRAKTKHNTTAYYVTACPAIKRSFKFSRHASANEANPCHRTSYSPQAHTRALAVLHAGRWPNVTVSYKWIALNHLWAPMHASRSM